MDYTTASHGGMHVSTKRYAAMPSYFKYGEVYLYAPPQWYEEDCAWSMVFLSFPEEMKQHYGEKNYSSLLDTACKTLDQYYPKQLEKFLADNPNIYAKGAK